MSERKAIVPAGMEAVYEKIRVGVWVEGRHYRRAPDGHILIDLEAFERWVEGHSQAA